MKILVTESSGLVGTRLAKKQKEGNLTCDTIPRDIKIFDFNTHFIGTLEKRRSIIHMVTLPIK